MSGKSAKKLRWLARVQEAGMPDIMVNEKGIPSTVLVYDHPKVFKDALGNEHTFIRRTVQYNPRTSGKGYYRALKATKIKIRGNLPLVRQTCQFRIIRTLTEKQQRAGDVAQPNAEALAVAAAGMGGPVQTTASASLPVVGITGAT